MAAPNDPVQGTPRRSRQRAYRRLRLLLLLTGLTSFGILFALFRAGARSSRGVEFGLALTLLALCTLAWWTFADAVLNRGRHPAALRGVLAAVTLGLLWPLLYSIAFGGLPTFLGTPVLVAGTIQLWHMMIVLLLPAATVAGYAGWLVYRAWTALIRIRARRALSKVRPASSSQAVDDESPAWSRRDVLAAAGIYAPLVLAGGAGIAGAQQVGAFDVNRHRLEAPWLPRRLSGLRITHISDLHLGRLYRPHMLGRLVREANRLDGDIVVVTGDIVDSSNELLPPAIDALRELRHRHGLYLCLGNHDLIDDRDALVRTIRRAGLTLLINQRETLTVAGERLTIAGLDWSSRDEGIGPRRGHRQNTTETLRGYDPRDEGPCIALAHHPHAFDALADAGIPLTLSGHTHGGQIMWRAPIDGLPAEGKDDRGVGGLLFRYLRGFYRRAASTLFVNSGVGNWFPTRINAPAEIVRIELIRPT